jgi:hypothetical protein
MSVGVNPPKTPVTKGSNGVAMATIPNICKMPGPPAPFVPTPLPNIGRSALSPKGYSRSVKIKGSTVAIRGATFNSIGDIASKATGGGVVSSNTHGPTKFIGPGSFNVKVEGKNVQLLSDPMLNNCGPSGSPPNSATLVGVLQMCGMLAAIVGDEPCALCKQQHGEDGKLEESVDTRAAITKLKEHSVNAAQKMRSKVPDGAGKKQKKRAEINKMGGVALCEDAGLVFAAVSGTQLAELAQEITSADWHMDVGFLEAQFMEDRGGNTTNAANARKKSLLGQMSGDSNKATFEEKFKLCLDKVDLQNQKRQKGGASEGKTLSEICAENEHYNFPGSCAAQQAVVLALEHGHRPKGLTERRWHTGSPADSQPKTAAWRRDYDESGALKTIKNVEYGGNDAVPPCGTCQVILPMLLCPENSIKECAPVGPPGGCRCK